MNMQTPGGWQSSVAEGPLRRHAHIARALGSPFVASVLEAGERQLDRAPATAALIRHWEGDASLDALAMRFNAALHALARQRMSPDLSALYTGAHDAFDRAIGDALGGHDLFIASWLRRTPQTNEVGRSAAIAAALLIVRHQFGLPFTLLELGASCGLNLNLGRYAYQLGKVRAGDVGSAVHIAPAWNGGGPAAAPIEIVEARGVDLNPLQASDPDMRERLMSCVWADQPQRAMRLEQALILAQRHPPRVDQGDVAPWLAERLADPQPDNVCRVIYHSMFKQYLPVSAREQLTALIRAAGAGASARRPLALISFEWTATRHEVQLCLSTWPDGTRRLLANCHAYGDWIDWLG